MYKAGFVVTINVASRQQLPPWTYTTVADIPDGYRPIYDVTSIGTDSKSMVAIVAQEEGGLVLNPFGNAVSSDDRIYGSITYVTG